MLGAEHNDSIVRRGIDEPLAWQDRMERTSVTPSLLSRMIAWSVTLGRSLAPRNSAPVRRLGLCVIPTLSPRCVAVVALTIATMLWGSAAVATKLVVSGGIPPLTLAALRFAVALVLLRLLLAARHNRPARGRDPAVLGLTGVALFAVCRNLGLVAAPATNAALLDAATPALILLLAAITLGERHGSRRLWGVGLALIGVVAVSLGHAGAGPVGSLGGDGLLFASAAAFAGYTVLGRRVGAGGDALALVAGAVGYGLLALLPAAALELAIGGLPTPDLGDALLVLYLGAGPSALAFALWGFGLTRIEAGQVAVIDCLTPVFGLAAAVLLGERLVPLQMAGGVLILIGAWIATPTGLRHAAQRSVATVPELAAVPS